MTQALHVAAELGIAGHRDGGPLSPEELANGTGAQPGAIWRILRALARAGVFGRTSLDDSGSRPLPRPWALPADRPMPSSNLTNSIRPGAI